MKSVNGMFNGAREKLLRVGLNNLTDSELVSLLLRTGSRSCPVGKSAATLVRQHGVDGLLALDYDALARYPGVSLAKAATILAAGELGRRCRFSRDPGKIVLSDSSKVAEEVADIRRYSQEHFLALYLNARNELIAREELFVGTLDATLVHPREIFAGALRYRSAYIAVVHNHPSGSPEPSEADKRLTKRLEEAGKLLGILLVDHVIVGRSGFYSFAEQGQLG